MKTCLGNHPVKLLPRGLPRHAVPVVMAGLLALAAAEVSAGLPDIDLAARVQLDHGRFSGVVTRDGRPASATYVRRAEISAAVRPAPRWRLAATLAREDDRAVLDTAAVSWRPHDGLQLRAGRVDPDFGLDNTNSSSWTAGIERSAIWDLAPGIADATRGWGARADAHGPGWHASAGLYDKRDRTSLVGRGVWLPAAAPSRVLQLGASLARSVGMDDSGRVRTRLGLRGVTEDPAGRRRDLAPSLRAPARYGSESVLGLELALQHGPWLLQAEALGRRLDAGTGAPSRSVSGRSVQLAWAPDGGHRRHDPTDASFGRPAGDDLAAGRWELFYRHDRLSGTAGQAARVQTLGASWFMGATWRVSANVVSNRSDDANSRGQRSGRGHVLRLQAMY